VSAVLHAAAGLVLFLLPALSPEALPESQGPQPVVLMPAVIVPARTPVAHPPSGGGGMRRPASMPMPVDERPPAVEPATVDDNSAGLIIGEPTGERGGGPEGPGPGGPDSGGPGSDGDGGGAIGSRGPVRPGGDLRPPAKVRHVTPAYPELARRAGVEGVVVLECVIDPSGHVAEVRILRSQPLLDAAAVEAVRQWVYRPTRLNGVPVAVLLTVTVQFRIPR
jgi:protein TonB